MRGGGLLLARRSSGSPRRSAPFRRARSPPPPPCGRAGSRSRRGWETPAERRRPSSRGRGRDRRRRRRARRSGSRRCRARTRSTAGTAAGDPCARGLSSCACAASTAACRTCASGCAAGRQRSRSSAGSASNRSPASIVDRRRSDSQHPRQRRSAPASAPPAPGSAASARRRARRRCATLRRPAAAGCRRACGRSAPARRGDRDPPARRRPPAAAATTSRNAAPTARLDLEARQRLARARAGDRGFGARDGRRRAGRNRTASQENERAGRAAPDAAGRRRRQHGPGHRRESPTAGRPGRRCCWPSRGSTARASPAAADRRTCATSTPAVDALHLLRAPRAPSDSARRRTGCACSSVSAAAAACAAAERRGSQHEDQRSTGSSVERCHVSPCSNISPNNSWTRCRAITSALRPAGVARYTRRLRPAFSVCCERR